MSFTSSILNMSLSYLFSVAFLVLKKLTESPGKTSPGWALWPGCQATCQALDRYDTEQKHIVSFCN